MSVPAAVRQLIRKEVELFAAYACDRMARLVELQITKEPDQTAKQALAKVASNIKTFSLIYAPSDKAHPLKDVGDFGDMMAALAKPVERAPTPESVGRFDHSALPLHAPIRRTPEPVARALFATFGKSPTTTPPAKASPAPLDGLPTPIAARPSLQTKAAQAGTDLRAVAYTCYDNIVRGGRHPNFKGKASGRERTLDYFAANPTATNRQAAVALNLPQGSIAAYVSMGKTDPRLAARLRYKAGEPDLQAAE